MFTKELPGVLSTLVYSALDTLPEWLLCFYQFENKPRMLGWQPAVSLMSFLWAVPVPEGCNLTAQLPEPTFLQQEHRKGNFKKKCVIWWLFFRAEK